MLKLLRFRTQKNTLGNISINNFVPKLVERLQTPTILYIFSEIERNRVYNLGILRNYTKSIQRWHFRRPFTDAFHVTCPSNDFTLLIQNRNPDSRLNKKMVKFRTFRLSLPDARFSVFANVAVHLPERDEDAKVVHRVCLSGT